MRKTLQPGMTKENTVTPRKPETRETILIES